MDNEKYDYNDGTVVDIIFFDAIGLNLLLNPFSKNKDRKFGDRYYKVVLAIQWLIIGIECMQIIRLYLAISDLQLLLNVIFLIVQILINVFKGIVLVMNADKMWNLLDVARYGFTSFGSRDPSLLHRCKIKLSKFLRIAAGHCLVTLCTWIVTPLFTNKYVQMVNLDGTIGYYQISIFNLWYPVTESMYNYLPIWTLIYVTEMLILTNCMYIWILFDCYLVTICTVLSTQFNNLASAYESIGHRDQNRLPSYSLDIHTKSIKSMELDFHNKLILNIRDNQNLIKKFDELFDVITPIIKMQIIVSYYCIISSTFLFVTAYIMGLSLTSAPVLEPLSSIMSLSIQFYIYCYVFNRLETEKSALNFGLYSSNWTEMDLKYKKTLLLGMRMNSSHTRVLNLSPVSILNLEMFSKLQKTTFSIVSVLLKVYNTNIK